MYIDPIHRIKYELSNKTLNSCNSKGSLVDFIEAEIQGILDEICDDGNYNSAACTATYLQPIKNIINNCSSSKLSQNEITQIESELDAILFTYRM